MITLASTLLLLPKSAQLPITFVKLSFKLKMITTTQGNQQLLQQLQQLQQQQQQLQLQLPQGQQSQGHLQQQTPPQQLQQMQNTAVSGIARPQQQQVDLFCGCIIFCIGVPAAPPSHQQLVQH